MAHLSGSSLEIYEIHTFQILCLRESISNLVISLVEENGPGKSQVALVSSYHMCLVMTKPVFGVSDKVRFKPVSLATETSKKIVARLDTILGLCGGGRTSPCPSL